MYCKQFDESQFNDARRESTASLDEKLAPFASGEMQLQWPCVLFTLRFGLSE